MATEKKTKSAGPAPAAEPKAKKTGNPEALKEARAAKETAAGKDTFIFVKDLEKGAPQAKMIVTILKDAGKNGLTRKELCDAMVGKVQTRQPQSRILGYYQKDLLACGAIKMEKAEVPAEPAAKVA